MMMTREEGIRRARRSARRQQQARVNGDPLFWIWSGCYRQTSFVEAGWPYPGKHPALSGGAKPWR